MQVGQFSIYIYIYIYIYILYIIYTVFSLRVNPPKYLYIRLIPKTIIIIIIVVEELK